MIRGYIMAEHFLSILSFENIAKKAGVARLSKEGAQELREIVEEIAMDIAEQSIRIALHAGRKTVTREDVEFVVGKVQIEEHSDKRKKDAKPTIPEEAQPAAQSPARAEEVKQPQTSETKEQRI